MKALEIVGWALVPSCIAFLFGTVGFMAGKLLGYSQGRSDEREGRRFGPLPVLRLMRNEDVGREERAALRRALDANLRRH